MRTVETHGRDKHETDTLDTPHRFVIPVYSEMPTEPAADPAGGKSYYSPRR